jgi:hypothetical protein
MHMQTVTFHATFFNNNVATTGIAMRNPERRVYFCDDKTGTWRELFDEDASNLHLHGRCDLAFAQRIVDGNLALRCSRTLVGRAA